MEHINEKIPKNILKNITIEVLKHGSYEFLFSFLKYPLYKFCNEYFDQEVLTMLLEDPLSKFMSVVITLLEENQIRSAVWPEYLKGRTQQYHGKLTKDRLEQKQMVLTLFFIKIYRELGDDYFLKVFNRLSEKARIRLKTNTKLLIKYASQPDKSFIFKLFPNEEIEVSTPYFLKLIDKGE